MPEHPLHEAVYAVALTVNSFATVPLVEREGVVFFETVLAAGFFNLSFCFG
jgi:hypothetical protein